MVGGGRGMVMDGGGGARWAVRWAGGLVVNSGRF